MSFSKLPKIACGGLMELGWLSIFGGTSHESVSVEPDRAEKEHLVCLFACFDLHGLILYDRVNNLSVLSGWVYLDGSSNKQPVKYPFALIFFIPVGSGRFLSFCFIPVSVSCYRTQHSDSDVCESRTSKPSIEPLRPTQA